MNSRILLTAFSLMASAVMLQTVAVAAPTGAIFTTLSDGSEVNFNIYPNKEAVYLDGGPGPGAPQTAAGLDDGTYVFQVTDPSGKVLLSSDPANCRQLTVADGIITGVVNTGCEHQIGSDVDHGATTVQLFPYLDTPNPGGEYKVWVILVEDFLAGCTALGIADGLSVVDCGQSPGNFHGFLPSLSKTDNFKVKGNIIEIDTRFHDGANGPLLDGLMINWGDTLGSHNIKHSYYNAELQVFHEAHVEAVEVGTHSIEIAPQPGCEKVGEVYVAGIKQKKVGPQTVLVRITKPDTKINGYTVFVDVNCEH